MTWFEDLTPYSYLRQPIAGTGPVLNVGWLEAGQPFPRGPVPAALIDRLWLLEQYSQVNITRGFHYCDLCPDAEDTGPCGHGEIRAVASDGTRFAAPSLIAHYVEAHAYQPPRDFISAVLRFANLILEEAMAKDLCLTCGSLLTEASRHNASRGSDNAAGILRFFSCNGCGCDYERWTALPGDAQ